MATSELGHYVRFVEARVAANRAAIAGTHRIAVGNLDHLADQYAQRRVSWVGSEALYFTQSAAESIEDDTFYYVWSSAPFDLHVRASGETYGCRLRLRVTSDDAVASATFRTVLGHETMTAAEFFEAGPNTDEFTVTSAAPSWQNRSDLLYLEADRVRMPTVQTIDSIGGATRSVLWMRARLYVWAKRQTSAAEPRLSGVQLDEYLAPPA